MLCASRIAARAAVAAAAGGAVAAMHDIHVASCSTDEAEAISTNERMQRRLDRIYAGLEDLVCTDLPIADQHTIDDSGGNGAYGELTVKGAHAVIELLGLGENDCLYDLGSGASRFIVQADTRFQMPHRPPALLQGRHPT